MFNSIQEQRAGYQVAVTFSLSMLEIAKKNATLLDDKSVMDNLEKAKKDIVSLLTQYDIAWSKKRASELQEARNQKKEQANV